jgi:hypothetical protein
VKRAPHTKLNLCELYVGPPGSGKSWAIAKRARELGAELPAYVVAHDLTGSFGGAGSRTHRTAAELLADLKTHPGGVHVLAHEDANEALRAARAAAEASARQGGPPVILAIDETVHVEGLAAHHLQPEWKRAIALRRHDGLGFLIATQYPAQLHPQVWAQATRLQLYRLDSTRAVGALERDGGLGSVEAARVAQLELERRPGVARVEGRHFVVIDR